MRIQLPLKSVRTDLCALRVAPMTESRLHCLQPLIHRTRNDRNQEPYQGCMGGLPQIQTRVDIEKLHAQTPSTAFRRHNISDCLLRSGNVGTQQRTRKNDSIDATQDATTHHRDKKEIQKD